MSVRFIIGPAASGKTHYCLEALRALERRGEPGIFLVPEQFTYSADRELLEAGGLDGLRHVRVLSFSRLAIWLQELSGQLSPAVLPEAVRPMLLRRVLARLPEEQLGPLAGMKSDQGLLEELGRFVSEVRAHGSVDFLQSVHQALAWSAEKAGTEAKGERAAWPPGTREKIRALAETFEAYAGALRELGRVDPEERLFGCEATIAALRDQISRVHFFVDGFLSFTRREREVLLALAHTGAACEVAFCLDEGIARLPFLPIQRSLTALRDGLERSGVPLDAPIILHAPSPGAGGGSGAPAFSSTLLLLESNLYKEAEREDIGKPGGHKRPRSEAEDTPLADAITLQPARTPRQEVLLWARQIDRWIRLQDAPLRSSEVAIILRSVEGYRDHIRQIFPRYGIPFFLDERRSLLPHPRVRLINDALEVLRSGWRRNAVMTFLRNPLLGAPPALIDLLENLSLEYGRDFEHWFAPPWPEYRLPKRARGRRAPESDEQGSEQNGEPTEEEDAQVSEMEDQEDIEADAGLGQMNLVDPMRRRLLQPLREMELAWQPAIAADPEAKDVSIDQQRLCDGGAAVAALEGMSAAYQAMNPRPKDADPDWTAQVEKTLQELLEEARRLWTGIPVPMEEFARTLRQGCGAARVGLTPRRLEQVVIGDVRRSRLSGIRCAIIGGVNEGLFPLTVSDDLVLTDRDRASLASYGITLGPSASARQEEEVYFFYIALTRASRECLLTWSQMDDSGSPRMPSLLLQEVRRALPGLESQPVPVDPEGAPLDILQTPGELGQRLVTHLVEETAGQDQVDAPEDPWIDLLQAALDSLPFEGDGRDLRGESAPPEISDPLRTAGQIISMSLPSVLYKTESTLPAELMERLSRDAPLVSSVSRLQQYATCPYQSFAEKALRLEPRPQAVVSPLETGRLAHDALERFFRSPVTTDYGAVTRRLAEVFRELEGHPDYLAFQLDESSRHRWRNTRLSLEHFLRMETRRLHASAYQPQAREISFSLRQGNAVPILLADGKELQLVGRIDRLDFRQDAEGIHGLVIDYKRSPRSGLPKTLEEGRDLQLVAYLLYVRDVLHWIPTGGLYLPVLPSPKRMEEIAEESRNPLGLRAHGLFLREERNEVDQDTGLLVGATGRAGQAVSDDHELSRLLERGRSFLASFASTQLSGWISPAPLEVRAGQLPCANCNYAVLCRFRAGLDPVRRQPGEGMLHAPQPVARIAP